MSHSSDTPIHILVVEDEGVTALDTGEQLESLGYAVTTAVFSGRDAVRRVEALRPDLVLMDIRLKGRMDGIEAAQEIRDRFHVPVIYATAYADEATVQRAKQTEPSGYLLKPFDARELRTAIEVALYRHRMERQRADCLAMLSHDVRNPLGVMLAYLEMLGEEVGKGDQAQAEELLARLTSTASSLHALVRNYLEASRLENGRLALKREPLQLNEVVNRVAAQYAAEGRRRQVRLQVTLDESLPLVAADPVAVEQIVTNLVFNGLKFTPQGGSVTISSRTRRPEIVLTVADTGPGIPAEHLPRLFDRYQPVAAAHLGGGTGLGLFIVKTLAEGHEGRVEVASAPGEGSRFSVILPAVGPTGADAAAGA